MTIALTTKRRGFSDWEIRVLVGEVKVGKHVFIRLCTKSDVRTTWVSSSIVQYQACSAIAVFVYYQWSDRLIHTISKWWWQSSWPCPSSLLQSVNTISTFKCAVVKLAYMTHDCVRAVTGYLMLLCISTAANNIFISKFQYSSALSFVLLWRGLW